MTIPSRNTWQASWNRAGARVALLAASLAAGASMAGPSMSDFKAMDANGDGRISAAEHTAAAKKMFEAMDANRDGRVTAAEMDAAHEKVTGRKAGPGDLSAAAKIKVVDSNGDGIASAGEHEAGSKRMFELMDTNRDGFLSEAEFNAGHAGLKKKP